MFSHGDVGAKTPRGLSASTPTSNSKISTGRAGGSTRIHQHSAVVGEQIMKINNRVYPPVRFDSIILV